MGISQFTSKGPTGQIYEDAWKACLTSEDYSAEEAVTGYVAWCIEDTIEDEQLEYSEMYIDYLHRVIDHLESYQEFTQREGNEVPQEIYYTLVVPYRNKLQELVYE
jgi:hypothetical protein